MSERSELLSTIATSWTMVAGVAVASTFVGAGLTARGFEPPSGTAV